MVTIDMKGKVTLVTGAGGGIGGGIAHVFAQAGSKVYVADLKFENAKAKADELVAKGYDAIPVALDVTNKEQIYELIDKIVADNGKIDNLITSAGIMYNVPYMQSTDEQLRRTLEINLISVKMCIRESNSGVDMILNLNLDGVNGLSLKKAGSELQSEILQGDSKIQKSTVYITEYLAPLTVGMPICYDAEELLADPSITNLSESILVITNNNDNAMNGQLCIAAYDAQKKMVDITIQDISIQGQKTAHVAIEEQISMQGIDKIKLLFISKDGKITPLTNQAVVIGI